MQKRPFVRIIVLLFALCAIGCAQSNQSSESAASAETQGGSCFAMHSHSNGSSGQCNKGAHTPNGPGTHKCGKCGATF